MMQLWVALKASWAKEIHRFYAYLGPDSGSSVITMTLYFIFGNLIGSRIGEIHGF